MTFKSIRELDDFDDSTPFSTGDYLAVSDSDGNSTRKVTVKNVIETYNVQRAEEQEGEGDGQPELVTDAEGNLVSADPVTAANLDSFVQPDSGLEIITTCTTLPDGGEVCQKKLSLAKSSTSTNYYVFLGESASSDVNPSTFKIIDFYIRSSPQNGVAKEPVLIGKTFDHEFRELHTAIDYVHHKAPAGSSLTVLVRGDVTNTTPCMVTSQKISGITVVDYNLWCQLVELNYSHSTPGNYNRMWESGQAYTIGMCVYNKNRDNWQDNSIDHNVYRCTRNHISVSTRPENDTGNWERLTPHNSHGAFSVDGGLMKTVIVGLDGQASVQPWSTVSGSTFSAPTHGGLLDGPTEFSESFWDHNHLDNSWGGLNNKNRAVLRNLLGVDDTRVSSFNYWIGAGESYSFYGLVLINQPGVNSAGNNYNAGCMRFFAGTDYFNFNNVDIVVIPAPTNSGNFHKINHVIECIAGANFRSFDSGWFATVPDPYNTGTPKHGLGIYLPESGGKRVSPIFLLEASDRSTIRAGVEYWSYAQKGGTFDHSRIHIGTDIYLDALVHVLGSAFINFGHQWTYPVSNITFHKYPTAWSGIRGADSATSDGAGPTSLDYSDTAMSNWDDSDGQIPTVFGRQFSSVVSFSHEYLPGRNFDTQAGAHPAYLVTSDGYVSWSSYVIGGHTFFHDSSIVPASFKRTAFIDWNI